MQILKAEHTKGPRANSEAVVATVRSESGREYRIDVSNRRCSCPAWRFAKADAHGNRKPCKHLIELGLGEPLAPIEMLKVPKDQPTDYGKEL